MNQENQETQNNTKKCSCCEKIFPLEDFYKAKNSKDGRYSQCKWCKKKNNSDWYKNNPEKTKEMRNNYRRGHKEKVLDVSRRWRELNQEKVKQYNKEWKKKNTEKVKQEHKEYYERHKKKILEKQRKYRQQNIEQDKETKRKYYQNNKEKFNYYNKTRYKEDEKYRITVLLRGQFQRFCNKIGHQKNKKTFDFFDYTPEEFFLHLQTTIPSDCLSESDLHIDHIIPMSAFEELSLEEVAKECFALTNLRYLSATKNLSKNDKIAYSDIETREEKYL